MDFLNPHTHIQIAAYDFRPGWTRDTHKTGGPRREPGATYEPWTHTYTRALVHTRASTHEYMHTLVYICASSYTHMHNHVCAHAYTPHSQPHAHTHPRALNKITLPPHRISKGRQPVGTKAVRPDPFKNEPSKRRKWVPQVHYRCTLGSELAKLATSIIHLHFLPPLALSPIAPRPLRTCLSQILRFLEGWAKGLTPNPTGENILIERIYFSRFHFFFSVSNVNT